MKFTLNLYIKCINGAQQNYYLHFCRGSEGRKAKAQATPQRLKYRYVFLMLACRRDCSTIRGTLLCLIKVYVHLNQNILFI